ncbi:hypothetical protein [Thermincola potens]|uniref:Uncharacterized protein n=1 Tax=Thermincola potens (strain JR) TaxID=635013 RepID=D5X7A4_THEPJ|nr:hypothetical protein [Thermincola potens]ADG82474.1 conserved hypothetical protein [Thermincola potens JR]
MPKCNICGNRVSFGSSRIPPAAPTANGPISGLVANFDGEGSISEMECMGADLDTAQEAWENPRTYFDICLECASNDISWV